MEGLKYIFIISLLQTSIYAQDPIIDTTTGKIKGSTISVQNVDLDVFLGIPFAKPPVGNLRFRRPEPIERWSGIKDTKQHVAACVQPENKKYDHLEGSEIWKIKTNISEDCLYLNIWAPTESRKSRSNLTTMIWIYGGSFVSGSTTVELYNGKWIAASQNIIVASMNYRVGPFGFLSLNDERAPGNMGLLDQNLAIKWIRDNIASFGGDPDKLTLFGQSAGAASVGFHVVSPLSRKLFRNAIMMSGSPSSPWAIKSIERNIHRAKAMASIVKCPINNTKAMIDCFLEADANTLALAQFAYLDDFMKITFTPVVDHYFLPGKPSEILNDETVKKDVLTGFVENEGSLFLLMAFPNEFPFNGTVPIGTDTAHASIKKITRPISLNPLQMDVITYLYGSRVFSFPETEKYRYILEQVGGDTSFKCPAIKLAEQFSTHSNVYMYSFEFQSRLNPWPKWLGVMHGYDVIFAFGLPLFGNKFTEEDKLVAERLTSFFANFSKSGNPSNGDCSDCSSDPWPKFTPKTPKYIVIDGKAKPETKKNYMKNICGFWGDVLPELNTSFCPVLTSGSQNIWTFQRRILTSFTSLSFSLILLGNFLF
ncbi:cholinesterase 2 [Octopus bimaculoides]|uniref:Carboxylic ester hydrolase n=1 Tax=Octopus bimaculoides TaxID=37653 RepID=A0A0L8G8A3_OCTBM|nr:cholinesterase 2 [Octopus bimaculoides]|eukprot:XP_014783286.1 PREDICTED: cholinesterase 2-like [Octopus bimaculoides]